VGIFAKAPPKYVMRWDCKKTGKCFNEYMRPKLDVFQDCFPVGTFTDIDGAYERNGHLLLLEWKSPGVELPLAQELMLKRASLVSKINAIVVNGHAKDMSVEQFYSIVKGKSHRQRAGGLDDLKELIRMWAAWAEKQPWRHGWVLASEQKSGI